jgi:hypothetical protein
MAKINVSAAQLTVLSGNLEAILFSGSSAFEDYADTSTLPERLIGLFKVTTNIMDRVLVSTTISESLRVVEEEQARNIKDLLKNGERKLVVLIGA